jgi:hypothetical protein
MTTKEARDLGYYVMRGSYVGTTDDRLDGWYIGRIGEPSRHHGAGYRTRREALDALEMHIASLV